MTSKLPYFNYPTYGSVVFTDKIIIPKEWTDVITKEIEDGTSPLIEIMRDSRRWFNFKDDDEYLLKMVKGE